MVAGHAKGSAYEREICKRLSRWVSAGKDESLFWRSAMSGGRATFGLKSGKLHSNQAGDICAVSPEGHALTSIFYVECKFYRDLDLTSFFLTGKGVLSKFWKTALVDAARHSREPLLIVRQNRLADLVVCKPGALNKITDAAALGNKPRVRVMCVGTADFEVRYLKDVLAAPFLAAQR